MHTPFPSRWEQRMRANIAQQTKGTIAISLAPTDSESGAEEPLLSKIRPSPLHSTVEKPMAKQPHEQHIRRPETPPARKKSHNRNTQPQQTTA